jgi:HK97 gp10 family phage protein
MKIEIAGAQEIIKALEQLAPKVEKKILRQAIRKGLKPLLDEAKDQAPVDTGDLRKSLTIRVAKSQKRGTIALEVRPNERKYDGRFYYPAIVEYGRKKARPMEPNPFMAKAFEGKAEEAKDVALREIKRGIDALTGGS